MAIPWLIGAAVVGVIGAAISSSSNDDDEEERRLARAEARAEQDNQRKRAEAEAKARQEKIDVQNKAHAQRFISKYSLDLSPEELISSASPVAAIVRGGIFGGGVGGISVKLDEPSVQARAMAAYNSSDKCIKRSQHIEHIQEQLEELKRIEHELIEL